MNAEARQLEKRAIRAAFSAAVAQYDSVAEVQRRIADKLISMTPSARRALDAGCGTGYGAALLDRHLPAGASIVRLDASLAMCQSAPQHAVCGDIEQLPLASSQLDLYWSSLAWQWTQPALAAREAFRALAAGGHLRVASLGPATLHELRDSFRAVDSQSHVRDFDDLACHHHALANAGFSDITITCGLELTWSADLFGLLRALRELGAHTLAAPRRAGLMSRAAWMRLRAAYEEHRGPQGLPATYEVFYLQARKPEHTP